MFRFYRNMNKKVENFGFRISMLVLRHQTSRDLVKIKFEITFSIVMGQFKRCM